MQPIVAVNVHNREHELIDERQQRVTTGDQLNFRPETVCYETLKLRLPLSVPPVQVSGDRAMDKYSYFW